MMCLRCYDSEMYGSFHFNKMDKYVTKSGTVIPGIQECGCPYHPNTKGNCIKTDNYYLTGYCDSYENILQ